MTSSGREASYGGSPSGSGTAPCELRPTAAVDLSHRIARVALRTLGIGAADLIAQGARIFVVRGPFGWVDGALLVAEIARHSLLLGFGLALALELHEAACLAGRPAWRRVAVGLGTALAVAASCLFLSTDIGLTLGLTASEHALRMHAWWNNSLVALVAVAYLTRRRESLQAEQRRQEIASRLTQARQRLDEIATRTGQSRLEPQIIFDCLLRARDLYPVDMRRGDLLLDKLTCYLRLTLGIASAADATVAREAELAAARIDVERCDADAPMDLSVAAAVAGARFPADLLGPLAHDWLRDPSAVSPRALRLQADQNARALRVRLEGPCPVPDAVWRRAVHGLDAFSGVRGSVSVEAHRLCMEIAHA